ncbi:hypothetical protein [Anaplasma platys]|uniref:hypothetical protein n=1 Tax=Anaplasma platys TaxID=949 RepID=UPI00145D9A95|nr:hypothetical protein [Anaplasma platys]
MEYAIVLLGYIGEKQREIFVLELLRSTLIDNAGIVTFSNCVVFGIPLRPLLEIDIPYRFSAKAYGTCLKRNVVLLCYMYLVWSA